MNHEVKLQALYRHMDTLGVPRSTVAPPAWRLLWRMGLEVPPPLFIPFLPAALGFGGFFGLFWGATMWLFFWMRQGASLALVLGASLLTGVCFGLIMAAYLRAVAKRHNLPAWSEYTGAPGDA